MKKHNNRYNLIPVTQGNIMRNFYKIIWLLFILPGLFCINVEVNESSESGSMTDAEIVTADVMALVVGVSGTDSLDNVTADVILTTSGENGSIIIWASENSSVINVNGTVTRPPYGSGDVTVALTATVRSGSEIQIVTFIVSVIETPQSDVEAVAADKANLDIVCGVGDTATSVIQDVGLSTSGSSGTTISWISDNAAITVSGTTGIVTRPAFGSGNATVTLIATIGKNGIIDTNIYTLTVLDAPPTDVEAVAVDKANLLITFNGTDSSGSVTQEVGLDIAGSAGTTISWSSDHTGVNADTGAVTPAVYGSGGFGAIGTAVILTATIEKNGVTDTKDYNLIVPNASPVVGDVMAFDPGGIPLNMVYVPGGLTTPTRTNDILTATVANAYEIAETEVTYELWKVVYEWAVNGDGGTVHTGEASYTFANAGVEGNDGIIGAVVTTAKLEPVTTINWRDAMVWLNALTEYYNSQNGTSLEVVYYTDAAYTNPQRDSRDLTCGTSTGAVAGDCDNPYVNPNAKGFRLPSNAEWELAARYKGSDSSNGAIEEPTGSGSWWTPGTYASGATLAITNFAASDLVAWFGTIEDIQTGATITGNTTTTQPVATRAANVLGLFDMSGNVVEWAFDWYPNSIGSHRSRHGGSWWTGLDEIQVGFVDSSFPSFEYFYIGFRPSRTP